MTKIYAIFLRQIYLIRTNPTRLVGIYIWIIFDTIQWGFITKYLATFEGAKFNFITVILGAVLLWEFMSRIQIGIMTSFLEDIWSQNFINIFASPIHIWEYASGLILTSIFTSFWGFIAMILIAGLAFGFNIFALGMYILPFILILFIFGIAMGLFITATIFRLGPSAEWLGWPIPFLLSIFTGVFYPISTLPQSMQIVSKIFPSTYVFESLRAILLTGTIPEGTFNNLAIGGGLALLYLLVMYIYFVKIYRSNLKTGKIAKFSAEMA